MQTLLVVLLAIIIVLGIIFIAHWLEGKEYKIRTQIIVIIIVTILSLIYVFYPELKQLFS
jgi:ABC-type polysaccharide/polyol phosphate export permease